jgi:hypothetical protein
LDDFHWHGGAITRATPVTPRYRSTQNVRRFLHAECGAGFKFDRPFMQWIKDATPKKMGAVAAVARVLCPTQAFVDEAFEGYWCRPDADARALRGHAVL